MSEVLVKPLEVFTIVGGHGLDGVRPVAVFLEYDESGLYATRLEGGEVFEALGVGDTEVLLAGDDKGGGGEVIDVFRWGELGVECAVPRFPLQVPLWEPQFLGSTPHGFEVIHAHHGGEAFESLGSGLEPVGHVASE